MTWIIGLGLAVAAIAAVMVGLAAYGAARWADSTKRLVLRLEGTRMPAITSRYDAHELDSLPAPVQRYFRAVLKDGQPIVSAVTVEHTGTFNLKQPGEQWKPFTSRQRVVTRRPGFVWDARIAMVPGLNVFVHDAYVGGEGILNPAILGLFSLADPVEAGVLAQGEFVRYLRRNGLVSDGIATEPRGALGGGRRPFRESHPCGREGQRHDAGEFQRRRPDRIGTRRGTRGDGGQSRRHDTLGRAHVQLPDARWHAHTAHLRGGMASPRGTRAVLARYDLVVDL